MLRHITPAIERYVAIVTLLRWHRMPYAAMKKTARHIMATYAVIEMPRDAATLATHDIAAMAPLHAVITLLPYHVDAIDAATAPLRYCRWLPYAIDICR